MINCLLDDCVACTTLLALLWTGIYWTCHKFRMYDWWPCVSENLLAPLCIRIRQIYHVREFIRLSVVWIDWHICHEWKFVRLSMLWIDWQAHYVKEFVEPFVVWIDETIPLLGGICQDLLDVHWKMWTTMVWFDELIMIGNLSDLSWYRSIDKPIIGGNLSDLLWWWSIDGWFCHVRELDGPTMCMRCNSLTTPFCLGIWRTATSKIDGLTRLLCSNDDLFRSCIS